MFNDRTVNIENKIKKERKSLNKDLIKLWGFTFKSTKSISIIYLSLFIMLSFLRPVLAYVWGNYIGMLESGYYTIVSVVVLLILYFVINWVANILESCLAVAGDGDIEQLDLVQANRQQETLNANMYKEINKIPPEYFEIPKINDTIEQSFNFITNRFDGVNRQVMLNSYIIIAKIISVISIGLSLYIINPMLCLIVLIAPIPSLWVTIVSEKLTFNFIKNNTELSRKFDYYQKLMLSNSNKEIKINGLFDFFYDKWKSASDEYIINQKNVYKKQMTIDVINNTFLSMVNAGSIILAIVLFTLGQITLSGLSIVMSLIGVLINDTSQLLIAVGAFVSKKENATQVLSLFELSEKVDGDVKIDVSNINSIEMKNIKYRYPLTDRYIVDDVDFEIKKGEKVAFVGMNGQGKTTFVKLITGLITASSGEIIVNGKNVTENVKVCNDYQTYVLQNPMRYNTFTVEENVFIGDTSQALNSTEIEKALGFVNMEGIDRNSVLGKNVGGTDLSGGEWQKLAIARAMYRNKDFIILDEPTSNLDPVVEAEIFNKYIELSANKTVIYVTHRISMASLADRIVVFDSGKIVEDGTHKELMENGREYYNLYKEQEKWYGV